MSADYNQEATNACQFAGSDVLPSPTIAWLSLRPDYPSKPHPPTPLTLPPPLLGISCVAFSIGRAGATFLDHLAASPWYAGLTPQPEDLATAGGGIAAGHLAAPSGELSTTPPWPLGAIATIAIPSAPTVAEHTTALALVTLLRTYRKPNGYRLPVIATLPGQDHPAHALSRELQARGAFVLHASSGVDAHHLHHTPLRAAITQRDGRLICVDLADYLGCWSPGGRGDLHVLPFAPGQADWAFDNLMPAPEELAALNIDLHLDFDHQTWTLADVDHVLSEYRGRLPPHVEGYFTGTTSDRLDGGTGTMDLVVVRRPMPPGTAEPGTPP